MTPLAVTFIAIGLPVASSVAFIGWLYLRHRRKEADRRRHVIHDEARAEARRIVEQHWDEHVQAALELTEPDWSVFDNVRAGWEKTP